MPFSDAASLRAALERGLVRAEVEEGSAWPDPVKQVKDFRLLVILPTPTMKPRCRKAWQKHKVPIDETY